MVFSLYNSQKQFWFCDDIVCLPSEEICFQMSSYCYKLFCKKSENIIYKLDSIQKV